MFRFGWTVAQGMLAMLTEGVRRMQIGSIGSVTTTAYQAGVSGFVMSGTGVLGAGSGLSPQTGGSVAGGSAIGAADSSDGAVKPGYKSTPAECQTCKERKYVDGSDENVSFKSAAHISPEAAGSRVRAHEGEHVSNAYSKAAQNGGTVVNASVSIHTAICPECGRTYVSGGTTNTTIRYNESNPYGRNQKSSDAASLIGGKIDFAV